jgi:hypothetical protein
MNRKNSKTIHATKFHCQTPLKFYGHWSSCPHFNKGNDSFLLKEVLQMKSLLITSMIFMRTGDSWRGVDIVSILRHFIAVRPSPFSKKLEQNSHMKDAVEKKDCF